MARAVKLGAKVLYPPMVVGEFGSMATLEDPTGAAFSFWQAGQQWGRKSPMSRVRRPGTNCIHPMEKARDFYTALLGATADRMPGQQWRITCSSMERRCSAASCRLILVGRVSTAVEPLFLGGQR